MNSRVLAFFNTLIYITDQKNDQKKFMPLNRTLQLLF
nr:MAG TPA_asm: hypothetical protein [Caudoviricetes sp.]